MATTETQISAIISCSTKGMVDRYTEARGVKKGHVIEEALLHHLQALRDLPADIIIPRVTAERVAVECERGLRNRGRPERIHAPTPRGLKVRQR